MKHMNTGLMRGGRRNRTGAIARGVLLLCAGLVVVTAVVLGFFAGFAKAPEEANDVRIAARVERLAKLRAEDEAVLHGYAWIDKDKGVVQIPVERAMELTVETLKNKPVKAAGPVETAPAVPAPAAAATGGGS